MIHARHRVGVRNLSVVWILAFGIWNCQQLGTSAADTNSLLSGWLNAQTNVQSWSADFVQTRTLKSLTQPLTATGRVWFAKPDRFRWELGDPARTIAVRQAGEMRVIYPRLKRVERYPLAGNEAGAWRDALALLEAGFPRNRSDLEARYQIGPLTTAGDEVDVALQPRSAAARRMIPQIHITFSAKTFSLLATELHFADGSILRNDFTNAVMNPPLEASLFAPAVESDYKVVEPLKQK